MNCKRMKSMHFATNLIGLKQFFWEVNKKGGHLARPRKDEFNCFRPEGVATNTARTLYFGQYNSLWTVP